MLGFHRHTILPEQLYRQRAVPLQSLFEECLGPRLQYLSVFLSLLTARRYRTTPLSLQTSPRFLPPQDSRLQYLFVLLAPLTARRYRTTPLSLQTSPRFLPPQDLVADEYFPLSLDQ